MPVLRSLLASRSWIFAWLLPAALISCSDGGDNQPDPTEQFVLQLFAVSPATGTAPLQASLTAVVSGGQAPYDYAWDFENDGSFDAFDNNRFDTTVSRGHQYNLRAVDANGASTYQAIVRITDSAGTVITSDPQSVTATASDSPAPPVEGFIEDELGNQVDPNGHIFLSGERLRFHFGDSSVLQYQWDFDYQQIDPSKPLDQQVTPLNPTFSVDSTQVNPSHVFYNTGATPIIHIVQVRVRNPQTGETATETFSITVGGTDPTGGDADLEGDISSNPSADSTGVITLRFDPTGNSQGQGIGIEPVLELSAVVSTEPGKTGVPPYEFYWDFENDGKIDKAADSPTIPYYDSARKVTVNPYLHNVDEKTFEVRLLIIDIKGHTTEIIRTVRSINVGNRPDNTLSLDVTWGFGSPRLPYVQVTGPEDLQTGRFTIMPRGSTQLYEYKLDVDGDGLGDLDSTGTLAPGTDIWQPITTGGLTVSVPFGSHQDPNGPTLPAIYINPYPLPNYYAAQVIVRALDTAGKQVDELTRQTPVSLVEIGPTTAESIAAATGNSLPALQDMAVAGYSIDVPNPPPTQTRQTLVKRGILVTGGAQGTTALRKVFRISESFAPPVDETTHPISLGFAYDELTPMTVARRGHCGGLLGGYANLPGITPPNDVLYVMGGRNPESGPLASVELASNPISSGLSWQLSGSELAPGGAAYPLYDFGGPQGLIVDSPQELMYFFAGGLHKLAKEANANVTATTMVFSYSGFDPNSQNAADDPADDRWKSIPPSLSVPRYDLNLVRSGDSLYAIGGRSSSGQSTATAERLRLSPDDEIDGDLHWEQLPNLLDPRAGACAEVLDPDGIYGPHPGLIYVYGGAYFPGTAGNRTLVETAEVFNPVTNTWSLTLPPKDSTGTTWTSYAGGSARLPRGSQVEANNHQFYHLLFDSVWYYGGEVGTAGSQGETNQLCEFIYTRRMDQLPEVAP